jgi:hypothetical protein
LNQEGAFALIYVEESEHALLKFGENTFSFSKPLED